MAGDDETGEEATSDATFDRASATSGPRRSTFTPPLGAAANSVPGMPDGGEVQPIDSSLHDDDELARALADDFSRVAPPTAPVATASTTGPPSWGEDVHRVDSSAELSAGTAVNVDKLLAPDASTETEPRPWLSAPAPNPDSAVQVSAGPPLRPVRRSLPDDQLQALVETAGREPGGTLGQIEELESQLKLRESESRQFSRWQASMLAIGTPDALAAVELANVEFSDVVQVNPAAPHDLPSVDLPDVRAHEPVVTQDQESAAVLFEPPVSTEPPVSAEPSEQWAPPPLVEPSPFGVPFTSSSAQTPDLFGPTPELPEAQPSWGEATELPPPGQSTELPPLRQSTELPPLASVPSSPLVSPTPGVETPTVFNFDDVLAGPADQTLDSEPAFGVPENIFMVPMAVAFGEPQPTDTDSIRIVERVVQAEIDDEVDETDRVFPGLLAPGTAGATAGAAALFASQQVSPPSAPIAITRIPDDEIVLADSEPLRQRVFGLELGGLEPTAVEQRVGRSARLFWLWFAANSSILSLALGATIFGLGMSLRQAIVAVLAGVALSFLPLGLTTLAGKRSGQPTMVVSRATFGLVGNVLPAVFVLATRVFWGAVLLWLLATSAVIILVGAGLDGGLSEALLLLLALALGLVVAALIAVAGYTLLARVQLVLSIITAVLLIGLVVMTASYINVERALTTPDGPWILSVTGAVLVFSFVGLVWATSGADLARYQRPDTGGASSMLWATFGATLPSFLIIAYGALLAASNAGIASGFSTSPLDTLALMLPSWYPVPLLAAAGLSLLSGLTITLYSGGFALQTIGMRLPRPAAVGLAALVVAAVAVLIAFGGVGGIAELFRDLATTLAVPTAAWAGIFGAEMMIRNRRFETASLLAHGGVYPSVRWVNLIALVVISAIGFGLTSATVGWLGWQGYLFGLLGISLETDLAGTDIGVIVALLLGLLVPLAFGIPSIRRQEATKV